MDESIVITPTDALGIIDMQRDFMETGSLPVKGVDGEPTQADMIANTVTVSRRPFGFMFTSEDEHGPDHIETEIFGGTHCVKGEFGQLYIPELGDLYRRAGMNLVKGEDRSTIAYSIGTARRIDTLLDYLRRRRIKRVFLCGVAFNFCVGMSAIFLKHQLFDVYVIADCVRSVAPPIGDWEKMVRRLLLEEVHIIESHSQLVAA
jgi:nicotinamidase/pyrazinamidase